MAKAIEYQIEKEEKIEKKVEENYLRCSLLQIFSNLTQDNWEWHTLKGSREKRQKDWTNHNPSEAQTGAIQTEDKISFYKGW